MPSNSIRPLQPKMVTHVSSRLTPVLLRYIRFGTDIPQSKVPRYAKRGKLRSIDLLGLINQDIFRRSSLLLVFAILSGRRYALHQLTFVTFVGCNHVCLGRIVLIGWCSSPLHHGIRQTERFQFTLLVFVLTGNIVQRKQISCQAPGFDYHTMQQPSSCSRILSMDHVFLRLYIFSFSSF